MAQNAAAAVVQQLAVAGQGLQAASVSMAQLAGAGGLPAAQAQSLKDELKQAMTQALAAQLQPLTGQLTQQNTQLAQISSNVDSLRILASKTHNATCGEGGVRPYVGVPNGAGVLCPPGEAPLTSRAALLDLSTARAAAWCAHYGIAPVPASLVARRSAVAAALGLAPGVV
jgi:hypothetical protein